MNRAINSWLIAKKLKLALCAEQSVASVTAALFDQLEDPSSQIPFTATSTISTISSISTIYTISTISTISTLSTISWGRQTFLCSRLCNYLKDNHTYTRNMVTKNYPHIHGFRPEHLTFNFWPSDLFCLIRWTDKLREEKNAFANH